MTSISPPVDAVMETPAPGKRVESGDTLATTLSRAVWPVTA
jgi:hypothetical protein